MRSGTREGIPVENDGLIFGSSKKVQERKTEHVLDEQGEMDETCKYCVDIVVCV